MSREPMAQAHTETTERKHDRLRRGGDQLPGPATEASMTHQRTYSTAATRLLQTLVIASVATLSSACATDTGGPVSSDAQVLADTGDQADANVDNDTGAVDAGPVDAGTPDVGPADVPPVDAGPCKGAVGCPCQGNADCDDGLCVGAGKPGAMCGLDCKKPCNDSNACTVDLCIAATKVNGEPSCSFTAAPDGGACSDGNPCTTASKCAAGKCGAGTAKDCDDKLVCTVDFCDPTGACKHVNKDGKACDDSDVCTVGDVCDGGACKKGPAQKCADGNPCTKDACDAKTGCKHTDDDGAACDDGDKCTGDAKNPDTCAKGACKSGPVPKCDDGDTCTLDGCNSATGCTHKSNVGGPCDDGSVCTVGDSCTAKGCSGGKTQLCDDGNPCTANACDAKTGCKATALPATATCTDSNACTVGDRCNAGVCLPGALTACDDNNPCTTDACDAAATGKTGACQHKAKDGGACVPQDDSCSVSGVCKAGACAKVNVVGCDDGNPCTADSCDKASGKCVHKTATSGACNDANACTEKDSCTSIGCRGTPKSCDDGNTCTVDSCDPATGCKQKNAVGLVCADGNVCTTGDICSDGKCTAGKPLGCDDGNLCTDDKCDAKKGCTQTPNAKACDDNNACTVSDKCGSGACQPGQPKTCNDGKLCTQDSCDPTAAGGKGGCVSKPDNGIGCNDGDLCTVGDTCSNGACKAGIKQLCNDGNTCTVDKCDAKKGCVGDPRTGACSDSDVCTKGDTCKLISGKAKCIPGKPIVCSDGNGCTADSCHPVKGCVYTVLKGACDDGNVCTLGDNCATGKCIGNKKKVCNDGNVCTDDSCDKVAGCKVKPNTAKCSDGNACTEGDNCVKGNCTAGSKAKVCNDGKVCTEDKCDAKKGCLFPANTASCSDGNACTANDQCAKFKCVPGVKLSCNDNNLCTDDSCNPKTGCVHKANSHAKFKALADPMTKNTGLWKASASNNQVRWSFNGKGYWQITNSKSSTQVLELKSTLDLSCATTPWLYYEERYYHGNQSVQVSLDGKLWTSIAVRQSSSDYVFRRNAVDLSGFSGKKIQLRFRSSPSHPSYWWHIRKVEVKSKEAPLKVVPWGSALTCANLRFEGPNGSCATVNKSYEVRFKGVNSTPNHNGYRNWAVYNVAFDRSKVAIPQLRFEERHRYAALVVEYRDGAGGAWQTAYSRGHSTDHVWRKRVITLTDLKSKTAQVRIGTSYYNHDHWTDIRNVTFGAKAALTKPIKPDHLFKGCTGWALEGKAWKCDPTAKTWHLRYEDKATDPKQTYSYTHYATPMARFDLSGLKTPVLQFNSRFRQGSFYVYASLDGANWQQVYYRGNYADYVWKRQTASLMQFAGKTVWVRMAIVPHYNYAWGEFKDIKLLKADPTPPVAKFGALKITCADWRIEGQAIKCDPKVAGTRLHYKGLTTDPQTNGYWQHAFFNKRLDLTGTKKPVARFQVRKNHGAAYFYVREVGGSWVNHWYSSNHRDHIWRNHEVDLSSYIGRKIDIRLNIIPYNNSYWGELRNLTFVEAKALPVVKFGAALPCGSWLLEGKSWQCDPKAAKWMWRLTGKSENPTTHNYWHSAYLQAWVDLKGTKSPQIYFQLNGQNSPQLYIDASTDGKKWTSLGYISVGTDPIRRYRRFSLENYVGQKIRLRMRGYPNSTSGWMELAALSLRERDKEVVTKPGATITSKDFGSDGAWKYDSKTATWSADHTFRNYYQYLWLKNPYDLTAAKNPELRFEHKATYGRLRVEASLDGSKWSTVYYRDNHGRKIVDYEPAKVSLTNWVGQSKVYIRFRHYPLSYSTGGWWLRKIELSEAKAVSAIKAPSDLKKAHYRALGQWKHDATANAFSLNNPTSKDTTKVGGDHSLWPLIAYDISALTTPTLTFWQRRNGMNTYIDVSLNDGETWQQLPYSSSGHSVVWTPTAVDLSAYKGSKSLMIRFRGHLNSTSYWWQVRAPRVANAHVYQVLQPGQEAAPKDWQLESGWSVISNSYLQRKGTHGHYTYARLMKVFNLKGAKTPKLEFEEQGVSPTRCVDVSDDGIIWTQVQNCTSSGVTSKWKKKSIAIHDFGGVPTLYVRLRSHVGSTSNRWDVRKLTVSKK